MAVKPSILLYDDPALTIVCVLNVEVAARIYGVDHSVIGVVRVLRHATQRILIRNEVARRIVGVLEHSTTWIGHGDQSLLAVVSEVEEPACAVSQQHQIAGGIIGERLPVPIFISEGREFSRGREIELQLIFACQSK